MAQKPIEGEELRLQINIASTNTHNFSVKWLVNTLIRIKEYPA